MRYRTVWRLTAGSALFLDRDGVLNRCVDTGYIRNREDFAFLPGVLSALREAAVLFRHIFVVTNQPAVGKGLMTDAELESLHTWMCDEIARHGGRIDRVYSCPDPKEAGGFYRKPAVGMGLRAQKEFPAVVFADSFMVGDTRTDMAFGHRLGMHTVLIGDSPTALAPPCLVERRHDGLAAFINSIATI
ncbi:MAG: HAD-IIIA family hydrolase [Bacteroidales bacterium]|nr:HAD-IIIA family hydrolase [Bacteroidales bacterium]